MKRNFFYYQDFYEFNVLCLSKCSVYISDTNEGKIQANVCEKNVLYIFAKLSMNLTFVAFHNVFASIRAYVRNISLCKFAS